MNKIKLIHGDCLEKLKAMKADSIDSIVTDPPYGLSFMGKKWDYDVPSVEIWKECLRVLKPGGHLLAFAGTRTQHRMAVRIEDAGFEIRDMIAWVYGSGFPKSLDVSKAIDRAAGAEREIIGEKQRAKCDFSNNLYAQDTANRNNQKIFGYGVEQITAPFTDAAKQWDGWGTALKPSLEPITVARKPLGEKTVAANVMEHGTGAINVDGCRVEAADGATTALKPAMVNDTSTPFGRGAAMGGNGSPLGRWPANLIHDGSDEVVGLFPNSKSCSSPSAARPQGSILGGARSQGAIYPGEDGSAARFFYCAKASKKDRDEGCEGMEERKSGMSNGAQLNGEGYDKGQDIGLNRVISRRNHHPTVKPTALMRYLCRLVTPRGGTVLDPFMGSGSTGKAAVLEGFNFIGIEREAEYVKIAKARISAVQPSLL